MRDLECTVVNLMRKEEKGAPSVLASLREVVMGPSDSLRRRLPETGLTPAEQVDVLVEQATDANILGRTYHGWAPWL